LVDGPGRAIVQALEACVNRAVLRGLRGGAWMKPARRYMIGGGNIPGENFIKERNGTGKLA
jgi:hypothetical protein